MTSSDRRSFLLLVLFMLGLLISVGVAQSVDIPRIPRNEEDPPDPTNAPTSPLLDIFGPILPRTPGAITSATVYLVDMGWEDLPESEWPALLELERIFLQAIDEGDLIRDGNWGAIVTAERLDEGPNYFVGTFNGDTPMFVARVDRTGSNLRWVWAIPIDYAVMEDPLHEVNQ